MSAADRNLLAGAAAVLLLMRGGLATLGYARVRRWVSRLNRPHRNAATGDAKEIERIVWAVSLAGRVTLGEKPCLPIAMATQWLLSRRGFSTDLRIGVMRGESGQLEAHAWVERDGLILIGESPSLHRMERLPALSFWT